MPSDPKKRPLKRLSGQSTRRSGRERKRTSRACDRCKTKKQKCGGEDPCAQCLETEAVCTYATKRVRDSKDYHIQMGRLYEQGLHRLLQACRADPNFCHAIGSGEASNVSTQDILSALELDFRQFGTPPLAPLVLRDDPPSKRRSLSPESDSLTLPPRSQPLDLDEETEDTVDEERQEEFHDEVEPSPSADSIEIELERQTSLQSSSLRHHSYTSGTYSENLPRFIGPPATPASHLQWQLEQQISDQLFHNEWQQRQLSQYYQTTGPSAGSYNWQFMSSTVPSSSTWINPNLDASQHGRMSQHLINPMQTQINSSMPSSGSIQATPRKMSDEMIEGWLQRTVQYEVKNIPGSSSSSKFPSER